MLQKLTLAFFKYVLLSRFKNYGELHMASADVFWVVTETERKCAPFLHNLKAFSAARIVTKVKSLLLFKCKFGSNCIDEDFLVP